MHVLLVTNSESGSATQIDPARVLVEHGCTVTSADIETAVRWDRERPRSKLRDVARVLVAGGDGSIGCAAGIAAHLSIPLGVVPAGTANDFARAIDLPDDIERACLLAATGEDFRDVDLARVDGRPFLNVVSIGLAPQAADAAGGLKSRLGAVAYPVGAAVAAVRGRPTRLEAIVDGAPAWSGEAWQVMVASTGAFGGWASIGGTRVSDGMLDLVVVPGGRDARDLVFDAASLVRGELARRDGVVHARGCEVELRMGRRTRMVVDGEVVRSRHRTVTTKVVASVQVVVG